MTRRARLILVRHSETVRCPEVPSQDWVLSERGRECCAPLGRLLAQHHAGLLACSSEPKARETAGLIGPKLGLKPIVFDGLRESDRTGTPYFADPSDFDRAMGELFARPDAVVLGRESADAARIRFTATVREVLRHAGDRPAVAVTHATVLSLFAARAIGDEARAFWKRLRMPSVVVLEGKGRREVGAPGSLALLDLVTDFGFNGG